MDVEERSPCCEEMRDFLMTRGASTDFYRHPPPQCNMTNYPLMTWDRHCSRSAWKCPKLARSVCGIASWQIISTLIELQKALLMVQDMLVQRGPMQMSWDRFSDWISGNLFWPPNLGFLPPDLVQCGKFTWIHMMHIHCSHALPYTMTTTNGIEPT